MHAKDIMTGHAAQCTPHTSLRDAAILMIDHECGCLPVARDFEPGSEIIGMVSERDLLSRVVVEGLDPVVSTVRLVMTMPAETVHDDATVDECILRLRHRQVDRLVVVDQHGGCCGIITLGDIAQQRALPKPDDGTTQVPTPMPTSAASTRSDRLISARASSNRVPAVRPVGSRPSDHAER
jgi:CBS domain-containing protein